MQGQVSPGHSVDKPSGEVQLREHSRIRSGLQGQGHYIRNHLEQDRRNLRSRAIDRPAGRHPPTFQAPINACAVQATQRQADASYTVWVRTVSGCTVANVDSISVAEGTAARTQLRATAAFQLVCGRRRFQQPTWSLSAELAEILLRSFRVSRASRLAAETRVRTELPTRGHAYQWL